MRTYIVHIHASYSRGGKLFNINESYRSGSHSSAIAYAKGYAEALKWNIDLQLAGGIWYDLNDNKVIWID